MQSAQSHTPLIIRPAKSVDLHSVAEVLADSFHPPQGWFFWAYPLFRLGIYEDLRSRLNSQRPYYCCLVATLPVNSLHEKEVIIGTIEISLRSTHSYSFWGIKYPYLSNLAVKNAYRRQGIARKLLSKCEQIAFDWGYEHLALHVLDNNYQAQQLYSNRGYILDRVEQGVNHFFFHRPRRFLLVKDISPRS